MLMLTYNFITDYLVVKLVKNRTGARFEYVSKKELNAVSVYCVGVCVFTQLRQVSSLQTSSFSSDKNVKLTLQYTKILSVRTHTP